MQRVKEIDNETPKTSDSKNKNNNNNRWTFHCKCIYMLTILVPYVSNGYLTRQNVLQIPNLPNQEGKKRATDYGRINNKRQNRPEEEKKKHTTHNP